MNLYLVLSEDIIYYRQTETEPEEKGPIFNYVIAKSPEQAQYLSWKNFLEETNAYKGDIQDITKKPKFHYKTIVKNLYQESSGIIWGKDFFAYCPHINLKPF